nr:polysaccharide biosynthesis domain-containing protein [Colletotrichum truncatum]KAF6789932.1 polysaccharide biosynthesis domain-containing protein [Colletotrichum truncatum]
METYWKILEKVKGSTLRLTKIDDEIYEHFQKEFPEFDPAATINEDEMKSKDGKDRWRKFMMAYEKKVDDYNFGTMVRANPKWEYGQNEVIFGKIFCVVDAFPDCWSPSLNYGKQYPGCSFMLLRLPGTARA